MASSFALFRLAAHTDRANTLVEKLYYGQLTQTEYDAQIYATSITAPDRAKSVPIVLTLEDTLPTLINYVNQAFKFPLAEIKNTKLSVLWAKKTFKAAGEHRVPRSLFLLDEENLGMVLKFMKASLHVEQFIVEFEAATNTPAKAEDTVVDANRAEDEEDDRTPTQEEYKSLDAKDKESPKGKEPPASEKGKEQETCSTSDRKVLKSMASDSENPALPIRESVLQNKHTKQPHTQQESPLKKESRHSGSSPDPSRKPSKGHLRDEGRKSESSPTRSINAKRGHSKEEKRGGSTYGR